MTLAREQECICGTSSGSPCALIYEGDREENQNPGNGTLLCLRCGEPLRDHSLRDRCKPTEKGWLW